MISYKLCKQLKEAGFKQDGEGIHKPIPKPVKVKFFTKDKKKISFRGIQGKQCYLPTLSELIEACGDGFQNLYRYLNGEKWLACSRGKDLKGRWDDDLGEEIESSTPEEAVANLWLKLNEKTI